MGGGLPPSEEEDEVVYQCIARLLKPYDRRMSFYICIVLVAIYFSWHEFCQSVQRSALTASVTHQRLDHSKVIEAGFTAKLHFCILMRSFKVDSA